MMNLKPLFVEMVRDSELVVFNRCTDVKPLAGYRRSVKVVSPQAEVVFENDQGEIENIFADSVPFDLDAPVIQIPNEDYGIWYVDMMDHPDRYKGKVVEIIAPCIGLQRQRSGIEGNQRRTGGSGTGAGIFQLIRK